MSIEVKFLILNLDLGGDPYEDTITTEDEIIADVKKYYPSLAKHRSLEGGIISVTSSNILGPSIEMQDDLRTLIYGVCLEGVSKLLANQPVEVEYFTYYGKLTLTLENDLVAISDNGSPKIKFPHDELLPALYKCGERFVNILRQVNHYKPYFNLQGADELIAATRQALKESKLL